MQRLREETGAGVMECKRALDEAGGDRERARALICERGLERAEKKADRATGAGLLVSYLHNRRVGVLAELRCETDFVANAADVQSLAKDVAMHIAAMDPKTVSELLEQPYIRDERITVSALIRGVVARVGENIQVARFARYEI